MIFGKSVILISALVAKASAQTCTAAEIEQFPADLALIQVGYECSKTHQATTVDECFTAIAAEGGDCAQCARTVVEADNTQCFNDFLFDHDISACMVALNAKFVTDCSPKPEETTEASGSMSNMMSVAVAAAIVVASL